MPLEAGTRLGPYEIIELIGAGGMGEVYRARDTRLDRSVALKISAEQFTDRFAREAKVISSLNHPRVCTLHDVGPNYLVMELVEGETLAARIARGAIPLDEALPLARQIVEGLEAAHEKGVVHRDLKPANIKITPDGDVKVLDFGLAKVSEAAVAAASSDPAASPTMTIQATRAGIILGTAAYMPPEQARGTAVDRRADSWAFGCVLFEMLTGKRAFDGESTTDVLAAVIRAEPDWSTLPATTPAPIRRLLKRCLEKDRKRRLPDIGVARLEIDDALAAPEVAVTAPAPPVRRSVAPWIVAAIALLAAAGAVWWATRAPAQEAWTGAMIGGSRSAFGPRLSPDGQLLAFLSFEEQLPQLAVMKPNGGSWTILTHDREHGYLTTAAWAPDGSRIYFDRAFGLPLGVYSIPPLGGDPKLLLEDAFSPEPLRDGSLIVLKLGDRGDLQAFHFWPESGRLEPLPAYTPLTDITPMLRSFPDGKQVVYYGMSEAGRSQSARLMILDLASHQTREVPQAPRLKDATSWSPLEVSADGEFVYMLAAQNDTRSLVKIPVGTSGKPVPILTFALNAVPLSLDLARDGSMYLDQGLWPTSVLSFDANGGAMQEYSMPFSRAATVLRDGSVLVALFDNGKTRLDVFRPGGGLRTLLDISEDCTTPATTFGAYIAFQIGLGDRQRNALAGLRDGRVIRRYKHKADNSLVASPDGKTLYYSFDGAIWAQPVDGGEPKRITDGIDVAIDPTGKYLYIKRAGKGILSMVRMPVGGGAEEGLPVPDEYHIADTALSPSAVDARGRILVPVLNAHSFYYHTAILDPASKSFKVIPVPIDGDAAMPGWTPDGRILGTGKRYYLSMWHYQRSAGFK